MTIGPSTNNFCHTKQILIKNPLLPVFNEKYQAVWYTNQKLTGKCTV